MRQGDQFQTSFCVIKKLCISKWLAPYIVDTIYFGSPQLQHAIKINWIKLQTLDPEICSIFIFKQRVRE